jgi:nitrate reductase NapD
MNLSGILVMTRGEYMAETAERLDNLPGVEVHYRDAAAGKIVVVQEAETVKDEVEGLKRIKALPNIVLAEMVHHWFEEDGRNDDK